jgi:transposase-like protein
MNILSINKNYNTQAKCLKLLESLRWPDGVICTYCHSDHTKPAKGEAGRHSCRNCKRTFSVYVDTIFEDTRLPLPKWFMLIGLMLNSKQGVSAKELERNLDVTYKTAYYCAMRVRIGMLMPETKLEGIIEMDESYFGGKPKKRHPDKSTPYLSTNSNKRGRGTSKISVAGMVERGGNVKPKVIEKLTKRNLLYMLKQYAKEDTSMLMTDGFKGYSNLDDYIEHMSVNHSKQFSKGITHINTIEGFWSYVKGGLKSYKAVSPKYLPFYLVQYEWQYNHRNYRGNQFEAFLTNALQREKELEYWKAENAEEVKHIAYPNK